MPSSRVRTQYPKIYSIVTPTPTKSRVLTSNTLTITPWLSPNNGRIKDLMYNSAKFIALPLRAAGISTHLKLPLLYSN